MFKAFVAALGLICGLPLDLMLRLANGTVGQIIGNVDGVRVVHNKKGGVWGDDPKIALEPVRTIGDVDTDDENLAFSSPLDMAAASSSTSTG